MKRTFSEYVRSPRFERYHPGDKFREHMASSNIKSLAALRRWALANYPSFYRSWFCFDPVQTGRQLLGDIWADYLYWRDN